MQFKYPLFFQPSKVPFKDKIDCDKISESKISNISDAVIDYNDVTRQTWN